MSDYHILQGRPDGNQFQVVFHLPVPAGDNLVGVAWQVPVVARLGEGWTSAVPHITSEEEVQLLVGELYEYVWSYNTHPGISLVGKRDELDIKFVALSSAIIVTLQNRYEFYGFDRDVP